MGGDTTHMKKPGRLYVSGPPGGSRVNPMGGIATPTVDAEEPMGTPTKNTMLRNR